MKLKKIKNQLLVIAAKWFDKVNGNTYHSVKVLVDNVEVGKANFVYGYGDQYWETAKGLLQKAGYIEDSKDGKYDFEHKWARDEKHRSKVVKIVNDVPRQRDLKNF